jgi:ADP-glucose pyrophosphorylase
MELTNKRIKPAVYFGANSRIIDFALSNALNCSRMSDYTSTLPARTLDRV